MFWFTVKAYTKRSDRKEKKESPQGPKEKKESPQGPSSEASRLATPSAANHLADLKTPFGTCISANALYGFQTIEDEKQDLIYKFYRMQNKGIPVNLERMDFKMKDLIIIVYGHNSKI